MHRTTFPGAINYPAIDDTERQLVGTLYKKESVFEAKKKGASFISSNIAKYLQNNFSQHDNNWRPLIYCWRGGNRSKAFTHILQEIGWQAVQLPGGYKSYRSMVREALYNLEAQFHFIVLCGRTGVGKSLLLRILAEHDAQVLDLEALANHRGSVLGEPTQGKQPTQKYFDSLLCKQLSMFDTHRPVYVEAESRKIGKVQLPELLLQRMHSAQCLVIDATLDARIRYLINEYQHFLEDRELLKQAMRGLTSYIGAQKIKQWIDWETDQDIEAFVRALLTTHYDPIYLRSMHNHFKNYATATVIQLDVINRAATQQAATRILALSAAS